MRIAFLALVALVACAPVVPGAVHYPPQAPLPAAEVEQIERTAAANAEANLRLFQQTSRPPTDAEVALVERERRMNQAAAICRERGNVAATQPAYGGPGLAGAINAGMQLGLAGSSAEASCFRTYQATGIMPTY